MVPLQFLSVAWRESEEDAHVEAISKLQELEELHLELDYLSKENIFKLLALPKLRRLRFDEFEEVEELLKNISEIKGVDVVALTCNENFWLYLTSNHFRNVQKLCIINEGVVEGIWSAPSFNEIIKEFSSLIELYLEDTTIWGTGAEFWELISYCPQLHLLYLENYEIDDQFLEFNASIMDKALTHRKDHLVVHFVNTYREELVSKFIQLFICFSFCFIIHKIAERLQHPKLELSFKAIKNAYPNLSGGLIELEFKTS